MPVHRTVSALALAAVLTGSGYAASAPHQSTHAPQGCIATGNGFLRARIRGALDLDIDFRNSELECDGSPRPDGSGIRLSFAGPLRADGRRVRMVFGVGSIGEGAAGRALPTNLTVIFEGEDRLFATRGDANCTVDELRQERIGDLAGPRRTYRVVARGFCVSPANAISRDERILVSSFDFAGRATFEEEPPSRPLEDTRER
ncbi:MAG: hypothetical protein DIU56_011210 [Pseudomonadota bacterium]|jgi:hypothetical protein|nr:MAG: hypothetical protein DIU56_03655 [Pseudomonadota bacterium]